MVLNSGKCHYLVLGKRSNSDTINLNGTKLASSSYEKLLGILIDRDLSFDKHIKSLKSLRNKYNLKNIKCLYSTIKRTAKYGTETVTYRGPQIWNLGPEKTKNASSFEIFKKEIRKWKGEKCPCRIRKTYIQHVGLI